MNPRKKSTRKKQTGRASSTSALAPARRVAAATAATAGPRPRRRAASVVVTRAVLTPTPPPPPPPASKSSSSSTLLSDTTIPDSLPADFSSPLEQQQQQQRSQEEPLDTSRNPWTDEEWRGVKWTVYRGVAYDLTKFIDAHPAGAWLVRLAIGRDATALFESYHLRPEVAAARLRRLPVLENFPVAAVPRSPRPNDSDLYNTLRDRVRAEVFQGREAEGAHRSGSFGAAAAVLGFAAAALAAYTAAPSLATGAVLGLAGAWIGLTVQHCGNHGAMSTSPLVNQLMGFGDDLIGGSSLAWQYHHQVSHHVHCNDDAFDEDVFSSFPLLRFDVRQPRSWYHRYQHVYMWLLFPLMQLAFQAGDWQAIVQGRTAGATLHGATAAQRALAALGKIAHYSLLVAVPWATQGASAALWGAAGFTFVQGIVLAATFAVSHNVPEAKPALVGAAEARIGGGGGGRGPSSSTSSSSSSENSSQSAHATLTTPIDERDWAVQQVTTSADYGGAISNFMTGGLSLQAVRREMILFFIFVFVSPGFFHFIGFPLSRKKNDSLSLPASLSPIKTFKNELLKQAHHTFPAICFVHYPAIADIITDECSKRGIPYARYDSLPTILKRFVGYMRDVGSAGDVPLAETGDVEAAAARAAALARL